ncbi:MAG: inorganic diphosphatase [Polyangiales bacterium]|jgi:inorganic pyrophosphatase
MTRQDLTVVIDVPRGSFIKRRDDGTFDFVSPIPCPFNYGHVPGTHAEDGEAVDAVVLGPKLPFGSTTTLPARARIDFFDAGCPDPKWVCANSPLTRMQRLEVAGFFRCYAVAKRLINRVRGNPGPTRYLGWL